MGPAAVPSAQRALHGPVLHDCVVLRVRALRRALFQECAFCWRAAAVPRVSPPSNECVQLRPSHPACGLPLVQLVGFPPPVSLRWRRSAAFNVSDSIEDRLGGDAASLVLPLGWLATGLFGVACACLHAFRSWAKAAAAAAMAAAAGAEGGGASQTAV